MNRQKSSARSGCHCEELQNWPTRALIYTTSLTLAHGDRKSAAHSIVLAHPLTLHRSPIGSDNPYIDPALDQKPWFSLPDVRKALNVPPSSDRWTRCGQGVFRNRTDGSIVLGDPYSPPPASTDLLTRMIEYTGNVIIGSGGLDMLIPTNGTLMILQQITWQGMQGFQLRPDSPVSLRLRRYLIWIESRH